MKNTTHSKIAMPAGDGCSRRAFMLGLGMFGLSLGAAGANGANLAPKDKSSGTIEGRKLKIAAIGCGGMGKGATSSLIGAGCELVAVCDIDPAAFVFWEEKYPGIPKFTDYREMLKSMGDKFDAVQVGTPDHTHAYISIDCMNAGKHVYVQKPLARTVEECELMLATARRTGRVVQMGNQGHPGVWRYKALRDANIWGDIKAIYSWSDRPVWPQGMTAYAQAEPLPAHFAKNAWDCWCGPGADHGYSPAYHRFKWRGWWDYGCGAIGDMAVHNADPAFWAFDLGLPMKVKGDTCGAGAIDVAYPKKSRIEMDFAPNKWMPNGVKMVWTDGGIKPDPAVVPGLADYAVRYGGKETPKIPDNGLIVVGSKATTFGDSHARKPVCIAGDGAAFKAALAKGEAAASYNHYREFVEACLAKDPEKCGSKPSYAVPLTEALLIGCIALRYPDEELAFDAKAMRFTNKPAANGCLKAPKRGDWDFAKLCTRKGV